MQLDARTVIEKIQLMSHSFMVSSSMEILLGDDPNTSEEPQYKRAEYISLGEVKFDDPSSSQLKGRQLQTIEVQGNDRLKVSFVRLILKHFHFDKRNELNQVGLMGVSVLGICDQMKNRSRSQSRRGSRIDEFSAVPRRQDLAFLMYTDKDIAEVRVFKKSKANFPKSQNSNFCPKIDKNSHFDSNSIKGRKIDFCQFFF